MALALISAWVLQQTWTILRCVAWTWCTTSFIEKAISAIKLFLLQQEIIFNYSFFLHPLVWGWIYAEFLECYLNTLALSYQHQSSTFNHVSSLLLALLGVLHLSSVLRHSYLDIMYKIDNHLCHKDVLAIARNSYPLGLLCKLLEWKCSNRIIWL